jgi:hypothetical protein
MGVRTSTPAATVAVSMNAYGGLLFTRDGLSSSTASLGFNNQRSTTSGEFQAAFVGITNTTASLGKPGVSFIGINSTTQSADHVGSRFDFQRLSGTPTDGWIAEFTNTSDPYMRLSHNGNLILQSAGTYTNTSGHKLEVIGGATRLRGANQTSGVAAFYVQNTAPATLHQIDNNGKITYWATNTAAGTTTVQTINRPSGTINIAAGESSKLVNNSLCTTSSIVLPVMRTNDATALIDSVVPGNGSFTINLTAAAAAETSVGFFIIN